MNRPLAKRRGSLLLAVMIVVMLASMVGLSMMSAAGTHRGESRGTLRRAQSRALAWSGVLAVVSQLESHRAEILAGADPDLKRAWSLGDHGVIRLVNPTGSSSLVVSESGKLDVNRATPDMLAKLERLPLGAAPRIVQARDDRPFESAEELTRVAGLGAGVLYGSSARSPLDSSDVVPAPDVKIDAPVLALLTVFGTDGTFRASLDASETDDARIRCSAPWSDEARQRAASLLGEELATSIENAIKGANGLKDETQVVQALRRLKIDAKQWDKVLDVLTPAGGEISSGKVDINRANVDVLATIPGIDHEHATLIENTRESLSASLRASITWPLAQGVLNEDEFEQAAKWITTRSTMWRVRVEAGFRRAEESTQNTELEDVEIGDRTALEAVIDLTDDHVRVAYLREVTYLDTELALEESGRSMPETSEGETPTNPPSPEPAATPNTPRPSPAVSGRLSMDRLDLPKPPSARRGSPGREPAPASGDGSAPKASRIGRWTRGAGSTDSK